MCVLCDTLPGLVNSHDCILRTTLLKSQPGDKIAIKDFLTNVRRGVLRWYSPYTILVNGVEIRM